PRLRPAGGFCRRARAQVARGASAVAAYFIQGRNLSLEPLALRAPVESQPASGLRRLKHLSILRQFLAPYRLRIAGAAIALIVAAACFLVIGQGLKRVVDMGFGHGDASALNRALFALLGVIVVMASTTYV